MGHNQVFFHLNQFGTSTGSILNTAASICLECGTPLRALDHIQSMPFHKCKIRCLPPMTIFRCRWLAKEVVLSTTQSVKTLWMINAHCESCTLQFLHYAAPKVGISFKIVTQLTCDPGGSFNSIRWFEVYYLSPVYSPGRHAPETNERILTDLEFNHKKSNLLTPRW